MGKRGSADRQKLQGRVGLSKIRYCAEHNETVKPVKVFGHGMMYQCTKGCTVHKNTTVLKVPEGPSSRR
jgi:hypothetical protein